MRSPNTSELGACENVQAITPTDSSDGVRLSFADKGDKRYNTLACERQPDAVANGVVLSYNHMA